MSSDSIEEINYSYNYKKATQIEYLSKYYFLKDIYGNGVDINLFFDFNNSENIYDSIIIFGYILNDDNMRNIDTLENSYFDKVRDVLGIYDPLSKSGFISFDNKFELGESTKEYNYYLFKILNLDENTFNYSLKIFIDSKNDCQFLLPKNEYIRGSFNLINNKISQKKIFYVVFEETEEEINNSNNTYILEFSTNSKDIILIFNDDFNYYYKKNIGGVQQYFISIGNLTKGKKYSFTVQINRKNDNNNLVSEFYSYLHNYILKLYKEENKYNLDFINDINFEVKHLDNVSNIIIKNNKENYTLDYNYNYTYFVKIYLKEMLYEPQILNTTTFFFILRIFMMKIVMIIIIINLHLIIHIKNCHLIMRVL